MKRKKEPTKQPRKDMHEKTTLVKRQMPNTTAQMDNKNYKKMNRAPLHEKKSRTSTNGVGFDARSRFDAPSDGNKNEPMTTS